MTSVVHNFAMRLHVLADRLRRDDYETLVVSTPANIRYLTGFTGSAGLLICTTTACWLVVDGRYEAAARRHASEQRFDNVQVLRVERRYDVTLLELIRRLQLRRIGFEAGHVTVATLRHWQELDAEMTWCATENVVEQQRMCKDESEQAILRNAASRLSDIARALPSWIAVGRSERDVARQIDYALDRAGFERPAFETIVASGPNSAYPHARATDRRLGSGDLVLLDFGGVLDGYCVDLTRMAVVGRIEPAAQALYEAVRDAQQAALAAVRPGVPGTQVDGAARELLDSRGFGPAFSHGTGHGLGLEVHEAPRIARAESGARDVLEAGMVCTIEPGAYVEGLGGVRLEDDVLVTAGGCEVLTDAPRDLLIV